VEGDSATKMTVPHRSQITAAWMGKPEDAPYEFTFDGGPVNWREGTSLDLGDVDGVSARVLAYYPHAKAVEEWIADDSRTGGPTVRFKLEGPHDDKGRLENYLSDQGYGDEVAIGPIRVQLRQAATDTMLDDFLNPPTDLGEKGVLLAYYKDHVERISVDEQVGQKVALGDTGAAVEIAEYLANAKPDMMGRFRSAGDQPRNPLLELRVQAPGGEQPLRQVAFASSPLLNLDGVFGTVCPVKFHYLHPAQKPSTAVEFLQTSDGRLHARIGASGEYRSHGEVKPGSRLEMPGRFVVEVTEHLVHSRLHIEFEPVHVKPNQKASATAAAEVELSAAGVTQRIWLQRNNSGFGGRTIITPKGPLSVSFGYAQSPLGFALTLKDFRRDTNPGRAGNAAFASIVRLVDESQKIDEERTISMNEPLTHNGLTCYQSGFNEAGQGTEASTLSVAYDPGRPAKYAGSLLICLGIAIMFYMRAYFFKSVPQRVQVERSLPMTRAACLALCLAVTVDTPARAESPSRQLDWSAWRDLPVQNGGRRKPLDTLARETLRLVGNRASFADPETGEKLDPTALYLTMFFDWSGWDHVQKDHLLLYTDWSPQYFALHKGDKWDRAPLVRIDYPELREKLGIPEGQKHVSPEELSKAAIAEEGLARTVPLTAWAERVIAKDQQGEDLTELEEKGLELANRLWAYQNHRMGRGLEIMPIQGSQAQDWMPVGHVLLTSFDDSNDPTGAYRRVKTLLWEARAAYQRRDAAKLRIIAVELKEVLRTDGPALGDYPAASTIDLEVAYNRWAPFRFAWVLMLLAAIAMFLHLGTERRVFYRGAFVLYGAGIAAAAAGFAMRIGISGRAPVTNMYESVVYVGTGVAVLGLVFELIYRKRYILSAAAAVSTFTLVLADNCPTILDPSVRPLEPVLRSNFWLTTHVLTITLSYAAFALALGIANITLGYFVLGSKNKDTIGLLTRFTYKAIQVGVLLLAAGVILGGVWADYSWGRFWGWDPKEVWALVALLGYLAVLHARFAGWVSHRGLAALTVFCFSLVVMAWYGVNFVLGAGLHSYGFGGGGRGWVFTAVMLQLIYAAAAMMRSNPVPEPDISRESLPDAPSNPSSPGLAGGV
jgi:cytochrome c-type biogenesis protein CcsB